MFVLIIIMKNSILKFKKESIFLLLILLLATGLFFNFTKQSTDYGTSKGKFVDQVDSFSEYIIRNSVVHAIKNDLPDNSILIITKGYAKEDYSYYDEGIVNYYSNHGSQSILFINLLRLIKVGQDTELGPYFKAFRFVNCLLVAASILVFFVTVFGSNITAYTLAFFYSLSGGIALFSSNLYFMIWVLLTPLLCSPLLKMQSIKPYALSTLIFSFAYFSMRYEFATTFALLWLLPFAILRGSLISNWKSVALILLMVCLGFGFAIFWHLAAVADALNLSFSQTVPIVFSSLKLRTLSFTDVPRPFTGLFFEDLLLRLGWVGFSLPHLFSISKLFVLCLTALMVRWMWSDRVSKRLISVSLLAYVSWYLFAYQHIMGHKIYDSLIFSTTIQLSFLILVGRFVDNHTITHRRPQV
jgi:hypothetical protein